MYKLMSNCLLECYITLGWKGLQGQILSLQGPFISYEKNGTNMLECYIKLGWKGLADTNTLAYKAHS